jgi:hypothetical protein
MLSIRWRILAAGAWVGPHWPRPYRSLAQRFAPIGRRLSWLLTPSLFQERRHSECLGRCQHKIGGDQQRCPGRHLRLGVVCYMPLVEETRGRKAALVSGLFVSVLRASLNA